jgi:hypothetical protein
MLKIRTHLEETNLPQQSIFIKIPPDKNRNILYRLAEESIGLKVNKKLKKLQVSKNRMSIF